MIYFYMWVLFLVSIISALPIVMFVEKSKLKKAMGPTTAAAAGAGEVAFDDEPVEEVAADLGADDGMGEFGVTAVAADDFSAFEDFK